MVIPIQEPPTVALIRRHLQRFRRTDDVFSDDFLSGIVFFSHGSSKSWSLTDELHDFLRSIGARHIIVIRASADKLPSEGPYFATSQALFRVFKLFPDTVGAFSASLIQDGSQRFVTRSSAPVFVFRTIAVFLSLYILLYITIVTIFMIVTIVIPFVPCQPRHT